MGLRRLGEPLGKNEHGFSARLLLNGRAGESYSRVTLRRFQPSAFSQPRAYISRARLQSER